MRTLRVGASIAALLIFSLNIAAQKNGSLNCRENGWNGDRLVSNCEIREQSLTPNGGVIGIDGRQNGGIAVKGWDQSQILVRARVQAAATTASEAEALSRQIKIETSGTKIYASGRRVCAMRTGM